MRSLKITAAALITAVSAAGCGIKGTKIVSEAEPVTSVNPESVVFEWQSAYEAKLRDFQNSADFSAGADGSRFDLCDLTADGTPELIISPSAEAQAACMIYTYSGGSALHIGDCGSGGTAEYLPEKSMIGFRYVGKSFEAREYYSIEENELVIKSKLFNNKNSASSGARLKYEINNEEVSFSDYDKAEREFIDSPELIIGRKYAFTDSAEKYGLRCGESWGAVLTDVQKDQYSSVLTELLQSADYEAAFELFDLDSNGIPELIYSEGTDDEKRCYIYALIESGAERVGEAIGKNGYFWYDAEKKVYFEKTKTGQKAYSLDNSDQSGYTSSGSIIECGRKYLLNEGTITEAFR